MACHRVSLNSFPVSTVSQRPSGSECSARISARRRSILPLAVGVSVDHGPSLNARCAACTARPTSASDASGTSAQVSPVAGLTLVKVAPFSASTHSPLIYIWYCFSSAIGFSFFNPCGFQFVLNLWLVGNALNLHPDIHKKITDQCGTRRWTFWEILRID